MAVYRAPIIESKALIGRAETKTKRLLRQD